MCSVDSQTVQEWLEVPKSVGKHPALLRVPGYGETMTLLNAPFDWITFSFNPRGHGNSDDTPDADLGYWTSPIAISTVGLTWTFYERWIICSHGRKSPRKRAWSGGPARVVASA